MQRLHERMPVILDPRSYDTWLDPDNHDTTALKNLLVPAPEGLLTEWKVSRELNNPRHEGEGCAKTVVGG